MKLSHELRYLLQGMMFNPIRQKRQSGLNIKVLAAVLHVANQGPGMMHVADFYAVKRHLLEQLGTKLGHKWQRIERKCWGLYGGPGCDRSKVCKCLGTGVFRVTITNLAEYELGRFRFLVPMSRKVDVVVPETDRFDIEGHVPRKPRYGNYSSSTLARVLVQIFQPWRFLGLSRHEMRIVAAIGPIPPSLLMPNVVTDEVPF